MAENHCEVCNAKMFVAEPFKTTQQEIVDFAQHSTLPDAEKQSILQSRWIHPGSYCPNGCTTILVDGPIPIPSTPLSESIAIATVYAQRHFSDFLQTHGRNTRVICCIFCRKFEGVNLEGKSPTAVYRQPKLSPFRNQKIVSANCSDPRIRVLNTKWWYSQGKAQAECEYFEYADSFKWVYKEVTGWSEYPSE